jgi:hypothetical protein
VEQPLPCASQKTHDKQGCLPCAFLKAHGNEWHVCRAPPQTHGKRTVLAVGFGHFAVRLPKYARQSDHCNLFFLVFTFKNTQKSQ